MPRKVVAVVATLAKISNAEAFSSTVVISILALNLAQTTIFR